MNSWTERNLLTLERLSRGFDHMRDCLASPFQYLRSLSSWPFFFLTGFLNLKALRAVDLLSLFILILFILVRDSFIDSLQYKSRYSIHPIYSAYRPKSNRRTALYIGLDPTRNLTI